MSLNVMAMAAVRDPAPRVTLVHIRAAPDSAPGVIHPRGFSEDSWNAVRSRISDLV
jgi:hypothetical protein